MGTTLLDIIGAEIPLRRGAQIVKRASEHIQQSINGLQSRIATYYQSAIRFFQPQIINRVALAQPIGPAVELKAWGLTLISKDETSTRPTPQLKARLTLEMRTREYNSIKEKSMFKPKLKEIKPGYNFEEHINESIKKINRAHPDLHIRTVAEYNNLLKEKQIARKTIQDTYLNHRKATVNEAYTLMAIAKGKRHIKQTDRLRALAIMYGVSERTIRRDLAENKLFSTYEAPKAASRHRDEINQTYSEMATANKKITQSSRIQALSTLYNKSESTIRRYLSNNVNYRKHVEELKARKVELILAA